MGALLHFLSDRARTVPSEAQYRAEKVVQLAHEKLRRELKASVEKIERERCKTCGGTGQSISLAQAVWHDHSKCRACNGSGVDLDSGLPCDTEPAA